MLSARPATSGIRLPRHPLLGYQARNPLFRARAIAAPSLPADVAGGLPSLIICYCRLVPRGHPSRSQPRSAGDDFAHVHGYPRSL